MHRAILYFILGTLIVPSLLLAQDLRWFKGNTHCHTTNSDGDETPENVVKWYKDHGYHFLVITDHDVVTDIGSLNANKKDDFLLILGEEISDNLNGASIHLNAFYIKETIVPQLGKSKIETLQNNIDAIIRAGGIATINHPNWRWAFSDMEMSQVKNVFLFELFNLSYNCNNFGGVRLHSAGIFE
jgi:predicted metal-dependent phosphoesterase TrpH